MTSHQQGPRKKGLRGFLSSLTSRNKPLEASEQSDPTLTDTQPRKARVIDVFQKKDAHYAVVFSLTGSPRSSITVDLNKGAGVWLDDRLPQKRETILVWDLALYTKGWRAKQARLFKPEDEK